MPVDGNFMQSILVVVQSDTRLELEEAIVVLLHSVYDVATDDMSASRNLVMRKRTYCFEERLFFSLVDIDQCKLLETMRWMLQDGLLAKVLQH